MEFAESPKLVRPKALPVKSFREKPNLSIAEEYLAAKRFFWNSGMFFWKASVIRDALREFLPKTAAVLSSIGEQLAGPKQPGIRRIERALNTLYANCENISVDYAVLEKAHNVVGIPCEFGWNDLGSWQAVYDIQGRDKAENVLRSETLLFECSGLYVDVPGKLVAAVGVQDIVIVGTEDALLLVPRSRAQEVSRLVAELEKTRRDHLL
jgi:mannose-1-phosphate guanylyltransferase